MFIISIPTMLVRDVADTHHFRAKVEGRSLFNTINAKLFSNVFFLMSILTRHSVDKF